MEQGHALLALILIPLLTAALLVFVPGDRKTLVRQIAVLSGAVLFAISLYVFIDYKASDTEQFLFQIRYDWNRNCSEIGRAHV